MDDNWFTLYQNLQQQTQTNKTTNTPECTHSETIVCHGSVTCTECGVEVTQELTYDKEWKYYGLHDSKHNSDPSRCYMRNNRDKNIYADVKHLSISTHIVDIANTIYVESCKTVHRGPFRKGIILAAIFHAYKLDNNPQSCDSLIKLFKIKRKDALKGLKFINEHAPAHSTFRTMYITAEHIIQEYLQLFDITESKKDDIILLYHSIKHASSTLNRARPKSVGAGIIWYWIQKQNSALSLKEYTQRVGLSELTILKISREIQRLVEG